MTTMFGRAAAFSCAGRTPAARNQATADSRTRHRPRRSAATEASPVRGKPHPGPGGPTLTVPTVLRFGKCRRPPVCARVADWRMTPAAVHTLSSLTGNVVGQAFRATGTGVLRGARGSHATVEASGTADGLGAWTLVLDIRVRNDG